MTDDPGFEPSAEPAPPPPDASSPAPAPEPETAREPAPPPETAPEPAPPPVAAASLPPPPPAFGPPPPPSFASASFGASGYSPYAGSTGYAGYPGSFGYAPAPEPLPPPTAETLALPMSPRRLVGVSLDLLTRSDSGLRAASFYIGFMLLITVAPVIALFGLAAATGAAGFFSEAGTSASRYATTPAWLWWLMLGMLPASLGFMAVSVEAKALATAVIGGRAEGRPVQLRESIAVVRARFWSVLGASILVGLLTTGIQYLLVFVVVSNLRSSAAVSTLDYAISVLVGVVIGTPFIYTSAGIILGEASAIESLKRSVRLASARKRLAVVVTLFSVLAGLVVQFGLSIAADTVVRLLSGAGLTDHFPAALVVPLAAAMVFAYGTLVLLTEAIAAAPAVHAFVALTHYTGGLERGRRHPLEARHVWDPWLTPGLAACGAVAICALAFGLLSLPWG
jgi:hypothetical protein